MLLKKIVLIMFIVFLVTGIYFLGKGITGMIVGHSCCFPPYCAEENICDVAKNEKSDWTLIISGILILTIGIILLKIIERKSKV